MSDFAQKPPYPIIAIGDLQGCYSSLMQLLEQLDRDAPDAQLWFAGDLVNRGSDSLATLRAVRAMSQLPGRMRCVLGNHDLHLLAAACGARQPSKNDTLASILNAPDAQELVDWLRVQPLAVLEHGHLMVHAGVLPQWSAAQTVALASEVQTHLRGSAWTQLMFAMYGNLPDQWNDALSGLDRLRVIINGLTRLRFCSSEGRMDLDSKEGLAASPTGMQPWFDAPNRATNNVTVVCGHWSTLGLLLRPNLVMLDTGCVWGGQLSAVCLTDPIEHRRVWQVSCPQSQRPGV